MKGKTLLSNVFVRCYILVFLTYYCLPAVHYRVKYVPMAIASALMIALLFWITRSYQVQRMVKKILICMTGCAVLYYLVPYSMHWKPALNEFQQMVMFSAPMVISCSIICKDDYKGAKIITGFCFICLLYVMFKTGAALQEFATVCRALATGANNDTIINEYRMGNVGGLGFAYSMGPLCLLCFFEAKNNRGKIKLFYALICCCALFFVFKVQYTTLLILTICMILLMLIKGMKSLPLKFSAVCTLILVAIFLQPIVSTMAAVTLEPLPVLSDHLSDLSQFLAGGELGSSRDERVANTLQLFLQSPLYGVSGCMINPWTRDTMLETHSGTVSMLAQIGIIGFTCYMAYFWHAWKCIRGALMRHGCQPLPFDISVLYLVTFGFVNVIGQLFELSMVVFLFVPLVLYYLQKRKQIYIR